MGLGVETLTLGVWDFEQEIGEWLRADVVVASSIGVEQCSGLKAP